MTYEELDARRERIVTICEGLGVLAMLVVAIFAWVALPS